MKNSTGKKRWKNILITLITSIFWMLLFYLTFQFILKIKSCIKQEKPKKSIIEVQGTLDGKSQPN